MIINSVDDMYINALKHRITKYSAVELLALLTHLKNTYGTITIDDLTANTKHMTAAWNPPTPIETLWATLKDSQEFAREGGEDISDSQLVRLAYENINNTGLFASALKKWRQKPASDQTYVNFILYFTTEVEDYDRHTATSATQGYANSAEQIQEAVHQEIHNILAQQNLAIFQLPPNGLAPAPITNEQPLDVTESANNAAVINKLCNLVAGLSTTTNISSNTGTATG